MQLALFTPSAWLWPVQRNLDVFIASLGVPSGRASRLADSELYPVGDAQLPTLASARLQTRLERLQRELYAALLRPAELARRDERSLAEAFWPDLRGTAQDRLLEAFFFYFARRTADDLSVADGLSVLRAVFYNHEATDPVLWIHSAQRRLDAMRDAFPTRQLELTAPAGSRVQDLAFVISLRTDSAPLGTGWCWGSLRRLPDGLIRAAVEYGSLPDASEAETARSNGEIAAAVEQVLGWKERAAA